MTEWAIPFWLFVTLFLVLPLALVAWMTVERLRQRASQVRGFEVKLNPGDEPGVKRKENDHG